MRNGFRVRGGKETAMYSHKFCLKMNAAIKALKKAAQVGRTHPGRE